jgi:hypothetical protein
VVVAALAGTLLGCSGGDKDTKLVDYITPGKVPEPEKVDPTLFPTRYKAAIVDFLRPTLENPGKVKDAYVAEPVLRPVAGKPIYVTCVRFNSRDNANVYFGERTRMVLFLTGRISQVLPEDPQICRSLSYQRFPELEQMGPPG